MPKRDNISFISEQNHQMMAILDSIQAYFYSLDREWNILFISKFMAESLGFTQAQLTGKNFWDTFPRFLGTAVEKNFRETMEKREIRIFEWQTIYVKTSPYREFTVFPSAKGITVYGIDITERKKIHDTLRENEERFRLIAETAKVMVYEMELGNDRVKICSGEEVLGYGKGEIPASNTWWFSQIHSEDRKRTKLESAQVWKRGQDALLEYRIKRKQGDFIIVHDTVKPVKDEHGKVVRLLGGVRDITRRKANEQALLQSHNLLEQKAAEVEEYASNMENLANERLRQLKDTERLATIGATAGMVGHDIRNPLQAIVSDLYLLKGNLKSMPESVTKNEVTESLDSIDKNITYINKIVADLQDYARTLTPEYSFVNIKSLVQNVISTVSIPDNIKVNVDPVWIEIRTDATYIRRALTNLITNAVQAMPTGGSLTIKSWAEERNEKVVLTVEDTGVGIPENTKPKLFMPMMTTKSKGQGLGLAVVKRLVEALHGTITFESQEGKGTKFIIKLPLI